MQFSINGKDMYSRYVPEKLVHIVMEWQELQMCESRSLCVKCSIVDAAILFNIVALPISLMYSDSLKLCLLIINNRKYQLTLAMLLDILPYSGGQLSVYGYEGSAKVMVGVYLEFASRIHFPFPKSFIIRYSSTPSSKRLGIVPTLT